MGYLRGFVVTFRKLFEKRVTIPYPEQKRPKPDRLHGRHVLSRYEDGMEKCIGCELCAAVCPADCIYVRGADNPVDDPGSPGERFGFVYEINYLRCIHCATRRHSTAQPAPAVQPAITSVGQCTPR